LKSGNLCLGSLRNLFLTRVPVNSQDLASVQQKMVQLVRLEGCVPTQVLQVKDMSDKHLAFLLTSEHSQQKK
jgi:hypothetical protein